MQIEHVFVILSCIRIKVRCHVSKTGLSPHPLVFLFSTYHSKAVPLLQFLFFVGE